MNQDELEDKIKDALAEAKDLRDYYDGKVQAFTNVLKWLRE